MVTVTISQGYLKSNFKLEIAREVLSMEQRGLLWEQAGKTAPELACF